MSDHPNVSLLPSSSVVALLERLSMAGVRTSICDPDEKGRVAISISRSDRDRARSIAIAADMKPLRIESQPNSPYAEVLVYRVSDSASLDTTSLEIGDQAASPAREIREAELSAGGICIAVSGGDGAGKSTAVSMLHEWLGRIFKVELFHFGRPRPLLISSILYRTLGLLRRCGVAVPSPMIASEGGGTSLGQLSRFALALQLLCLARDRRRTHSQSRVAVGSGLIVICDRYTDSRISDMEGPRLQNLWPTPTRLQNQLLRFERRCYQGFARPDVHIILRVSPEVAQRRQPKDDPNALRRRVEAVARACNDAPNDVSVIDTDGSLESVHEELRRIVWNAL